MEAQEGEDGRPTGGIFRLRFRRKEVGGCAKVDCAGKNEGEVTKVLKQGLLAGEEDGGDVCSCEDDKVKFE